MHNHWLRLYVTMFLLSELKHLLHGDTSPFHLAIDPISKILAWNTVPVGF